MPMTMSSTGQEVDGTTTGTTGTSSSGEAPTMTDPTLDPDSTTGEDSGSDTATTAANLGPEAVDDVYYFQQGESPAFDAKTGLFANDSDPEGDALVLVAADATTVGGNDVTVGLDGNFVVTPSAEFWGADTFTYTVGDGSAREAMATVTLFVAPVQIPLGGVDASASGFVIDGTLAIDRAGSSVRPAGDTNGDGLSDVIVGVPLFDAASPNSGAAFVVFGKADGDAVALDDLGDGGIAIEGAIAADQAGRIVDGAADVDEDGVPDVVVGVPFADPNGGSSGQTVVVFGTAETDPVDLGALGAAGFAINGATPTEQSGFSVALVGDVNGDDAADVLIGANLADANGEESGRGYLVFGKADTTAVELASLGAGGFALDGAQPGDQAGTVVAAAGDVDGDGLADLLIGAPMAQPAGAASGAAYVVFGKADSDLVDLGSLGTGGFALNGGAASDLAGSAVAAAGDVNGDDLGDIVVTADGAPAGAGTGRIYVVFGKDADTDDVELSALGAGGFELLAETPAGGESGLAVASAGDLNGDDLDDLIIGDFAAEPNGVESGRAYVVYGKADTDAVDLGALGDGGFIIDGAAEGDRAGFSVSAAGDVNGDGLLDLMVGAAFASPNGDQSGRSYVLFGVPGPPR